jgi:hypothetical protein
VTVGTFVIAVSELARHAEMSSVTTVMRGEEGETSVGEVVAAVKLKLPRVLLPMRVLVHRCCYSLYTDTSGKEFEMFGTGDGQVGEVIITLQAVVPVHHTGKHIACLHGCGAADFTVLVMSIVTILVTVTDQEIVYTFLSIIATLKLMLVTVIAF